MMPPLTLRPRSEKCEQPYQYFLGWPNTPDAEGMYRSLGYGTALCTKPKGHPGRTRSNGEYVEEHGRRSEGPHGRECECGCHDNPRIDDCDDCWPNHIAFDACYDCAKAMKDAGHDPCDGEHYLILIMAEEHTDHDYWASICRSQPSPHGWIRL